MKNFFVAKFIVKKKKLIIIFSDEVFIAKEEILQTTRFCVAKKLLATKQLLAPNF